MRGYGKASRENKECRGGVKYLLRPDANYAGGCSLPSFSHPARNTGRKTKSAEIETVRRVRGKGKSTPLSDRNSNRSRTIQMTVGVRFPTPSCSKCHDLFLFAYPARSFPVRTRSFVYPRRFKHDDQKKRNAHTTRFRWTVSFYKQSYQNDGFQSSCFKLSY